MKPSKEDRLLAQILDDENVERLRAASLDAMLTAARSRRHRRALVSGVAGSLAVAGLAFVLAHRPPSPLPAAVMSTDSAPAPTPAASRVKIITDEELLALFPNHATALVGTPGAQRLVFLDAAERRPAKGRD
jgi:hypothetical protein